MEKAKEMLMGQSVKIQTISEHLDIRTTTISAGPSKASSACRRPNTGSRFGS